METIAKPAVAERPAAPQGAPSLASRGRPPYRPLFWRKSPCSALSAWGRRARRPPRRPCWRWN